MKLLESCFNFPMLIEQTGIDLNQYTNRQKIEIIEWLILNTMINIADELPVKHVVHAGMYARELFIPEGVLLTGKIHLEDHICILSQGDLSVMTDDGIKRIQAPFTFTARAGLKKIGYAHKDCTFTTLHATNLTAIDEIEAALLSDGNISWVETLMQEQGLLKAA
jgi:hypothetical protein